MDDAYSPLKIIRHLPTITAVREHRPAAPVHVQLILSDLCNHQCSFCAYRDPTYSSSQLFYETDSKTVGLRRDPQHPERNYNPNRMIPQERALEIIRDCVDLGVKGIQFTGGGEPTVHPDFLEILKYAQTHSLATALVTNGTVIGRRFVRNTEARLAFEKLSWSRVSIDAGTPETYAAVRGVPPSFFTDAWTAVSTLRRASDAAGHKPVVGVGYVVTDKNWQEVRQAAKLARDAGAHNLRISAQFSTQDERLFEEFHRECAELCTAVEIEESTTGFRVYNRFSARLDDLRQKRPQYSRCGYQFVTTYIGADLNVYRCCVTAYNQAGWLGSLKKQSFKCLWTSSARMKGMYDFNARQCDRCQFNGINQTLEYAFRHEEPLHSEFV
jgi:MoaA/NifB/PqqE/SkfB family radical SAM enzyme